MINVFRTDPVETLTKGCFSRYVYAPALEQVALRPTGFYDVARSNLLRFIRTLLSPSYIIYNLAREDAPQDLPVSCMLSIDY
jgi:hypothetical protein